MWAWYAHKKNTNVTAKEQPFSRLPFGRLVASSLTVGREGICYQFGLHYHPVLLVSADRMSSLNWLEISIIALFSAATIASGEELWLGTSAW